jgi:hypothetical protein
VFIRHIEDRYGRDEVRTWLFEVWNELNLSGFWEGADQKAYFELYDLTAKTIKAIDPALKVGGPSTAGAAWVPEFLAHVKESGALVDFVTTHTYGVLGGFLDESGVSDTKLDPSPNAIIGDVRRVREQISASAYPSLPLYFTEWSTSYTPRDSVHELLDIHRPIRRAGPADSSVSRRIRTPQSAGHSQACLLCLQVSARTRGIQPRHERSAGDVFSPGRECHRRDLGLRAAGPEG